MSDKRKHVIHQWVEWVNGHSSADIGSIYAPDCVIHYGGGLPDLHGIQELTAMIGAFRSAMPDVNVQVLDLVAESDKVAARFLTRGTHTGDWAGVAGSGARAEFGGFGIFRFEGDVIAEEWLLDDMLTLTTQLGIAVAPVTAS